MTDFYFGIGIGAMITGLIAGPLLTYFGATYFNVRRMEKRLEEQVNKSDPPVVIDPKVAATVKEAEELLEKTDNK